MGDNSTSGLREVDKLADEFMLAYRGGKHPTIEEFARQYPALAEELQGLLQTLVLLEQNARNSDNGTEHQTAPPSLSEIGDFLIVREIGRGGMGVVYEAVQQSLGRHVALKVLNHSARTNASHHERFRLESRAAASLHHAHIVPVFGVGECNGVHYYAMQFIQGQSLDLVIEALRRIRKPGDAGFTKPIADDVRTIIEANSLLAASTAKAGGVEVVDTKAAGSATASAANMSELSSELSASQTEREYFRSVARVALQVAEALAYAHGEGVLHRDVKPSNLLLDAKANVWISDFGLAKAEDSDGVTKTGDFVGTLRYMAPERLEGWSDRRSDIYGLGATLYELLTLRPLFEGESGGRLVDSILHESPEPPSKHDRLIPSDLETIVLTAIAKEPTARYRTAEAMAEDLQRFLDDRPILARRSTPTERLTRWCRRNPLVATLVGAVAVLLIAAITILAISNAQTRRESAARAIALQERNLALQKAREAVDQLLIRVSEDALYDMPLADPVRRGLLQDALGFYESFITLDEQDESLRFQLGEVLRRLSLVESTAGDSKESHAFGARSIEILDDLVHDDPDNYGYRFALAKALEDDCYLWHRSGSAEGTKRAEASGNRSLEIRSALQAERPGELQNTANVLFRLGLIASWRGDNVAATDYWERAVQNARSILAKFPNDVDALGAIHYCCVELSYQPTCTDRERLLKESLQAAELQTKARRNFSAGRYAAGKTRCELARYYRDAGRPEDAVELFKQSWRGMASVCTDRPQVDSAWQWSRASLDDGIKVLRKLERNEEAIRWADEYHDWLSEVESRLTDAPSVQLEYYSSQNFLAQQLRSLGKVEQADELVQAATKRIAAIPSSSLSGEQFPHIFIGRASELCAQNKWPEAAAEIAIGIDSTEERQWGTSAKRSLCRWAARTPRVFDELVRLRPEEVTLWIGHAQHHLLRSDWAAASDDYARVIEKRPISDDWFEYAYLLALRGDDTGYEKLCKKLSAQMDGQTGTYEMFVAARACAIKPAKCVEATRLCEWADHSLDDRRSWRLHVAGLAYLRAGKHERAIKLFEESNSAGPWIEIALGQNWFGLTIAHQQLGHNEKARECLSKGQELFRSAQPEQPGKASPVDIPSEWMGLIILSKEAEKCLQIAEVGKGTQSVGKE